MREYIVFTKKDHYNDLGIVRTLGEVGIKPIVVTANAEPRMTSISRYVKKVHFVDSPEEGIALIISKYAVSKEEKSFILTGDDVSICTLDEHYDELKDYFIFFNAGEAGRVKKYMEKDAICELAVKHGFNLAKTWKVKRGDIPLDIEYPIITKAINSHGAEWKNIVFICNNEKDLKNAYEKMHCDTLLLQKYIEKADEIGYQGFSINHGKDIFVSIEVTNAYVIPDKYSLYWNIKNCDDAEFIEKAKALLSEIGFEGIFEFEFLIGKDGKKYFLEVNFRNTVCGWITTVAEMPIVTQWCDSMLSGKISPSCYHKIPEGFKAIAECYDYDVRVKSGMISKKEWKKQYKAAKAKTYRGRNDFIPFFSFMWYKLTKMHH